MSSSAKRPPTAPALLAWLLRERAAHDRARRACCRARRSRRRRCRARAARRWLSSKSAVDDGQVAVAHVERAALAVVRSPASTAPAPSGSPRSASSCRSLSAMCWSVRPGLVAPGSWRCRSSRICTVAAAVERDLAAAVDDRVLVDRQVQRRGHGIVTAAGPAVERDDAAAWRPPPERGERAARRRCRSRPRSSVPRRPRTSPRRAPPRRSDRRGCRSRAPWSRAHRSGGRRSRRHRRRHRPVTRIRRQHRSRAARTAGSPSWSA